MATSTQVDAMADTRAVAGKPGTSSAPSSPAQSDGTHESGTTESCAAGGRPSSGSLTGSGSTDAHTTSSDTTDGGSTASGSLDSEMRGAGTVRSLAPPMEAPVSARPECLSDDTILQYRQGEMSREQLERIDAHLDGCDACRELVDLVIADEPEAAPASVEMTTFQRGFVVAERYEIKRFVGKGGMGEVYAAVDQMTGRLVALKTVVCTAADDARAVRKLLDEVVNAQRVAHPNVFKIYDLHEHRDAPRGRVPFFTMEFIEGESLGARLRREKVLPASEARALARQLLSGLSAAHAKGVLHLDFKSDNIMLRRPGTEAVIMDFGLSRASDVQSRQRTSERLQAAGTLPYMSLEQLECRSDLGPPSDVYSFGVVLYEMLTGHLPFRGNTLSAMLLKQLREQPIPPSRYIPISPQLEAFLSKCLARSPQHRYSDATRALAALDAIPSWQRSSSPSPLAHARRLALFAAVLAAVALVLHAATRAASSPRGGAAGTARTAARVTSEVRALHEAAPAPREAAPPAAGHAPPAAEHALPAAEHALPAAERALPAAERALPAAERAPSPKPGDPTSGRPPVLGGAAHRRAVPTGGRESAKRRARRPEAAAPTPPREPQPIPPDWHGPPPRQIPRPRPL